MVKQFKIIVEKYTGGYVAYPLGMIGFTVDHVVARAMRLVGK